MTVDKLSEAKARILLADVQQALACGTKHYALDGTPLLTTLAVIEALRRDGRIRLESA